MAKTRTKKTAEKKGTEKHRAAGERTEPQRLAILRRRRAARGVRR